MKQFARVGMGWFVAGMFALVPLANAKAPRVGFILSTMQEERYQRDKRVFEETAKKMGAQVLFASCNNSEQTQAAEVDNLLSKGVDVLVIQSVNGDTASAFVKQAKRDGVKVVAYDRLIKNSDLDAYITEDSMKVGALQAEAAVKATGGKGNYVLLMGQAGHSVAEARTAGILSVLKKNPGVKVVLKQYHAGWSPKLAMETTENVLTQQKNNVQAILANNSGMAHGAVQALEEQKLTGKVFVAGADADLASIQNIVAGKQQFEVQISIEEMAKKAAETAVKLAKNEAVQYDSQVNNGFKQVPAINTPVFGIDASQVEARIIQTGFHKRESVFAKTAKK